MEVEPEATTGCSFESLDPSNPSDCTEDELKFFRDMSDRGRDSDLGLLDCARSLFPNNLVLLRDLSCFEGATSSTRSPCCDSFSESALPLLLIGDMDLSD